MCSKLVTSDDTHQQLDHINDQSAIIWIVKSMERCGLEQTFTLNATCQM